MLFMPTENADQTPGVRHIGFRNCVKCRKAAKKLNKERDGQMICEKCGQWIEDGSNACSKCGAPVNVNNAQDANAAGAGSFNAGAAMGQPTAGGYDMNGMQGSQTPLTKKEFYNHPNVASLKSQIRGAGIFCYFSAGLSLVFAGSIIDALLILGLGLGIHLGRSRVCAIILTIYSVFNMIIMILLKGTLTGWLILLAGIYGIIYTFKYQSAWAEYQKTGAIRDYGSARKNKK